MNANISIYLKQLKQCVHAHVLVSFIALVVTEASLVFSLLLFQSPDKLLDNDPEFFHRFTIVIGVQLPERYEMLCFYSQCQRHDQQLLLCNVLFFLHHL